MIWGVAGLRPNFFSSGRIFLAELAQESWRDLAAVSDIGVKDCNETKTFLSGPKNFITKVEFFPFNLKTLKQNQNFFGVFQNFLKQKVNFSNYSKYFETKPKRFDVFQNF